MNKVLSFLAIAALLLGGCSDEFLAPDEPVVPVASDRVLYSVLAYSANDFWPFSAIAVRDVTTGLTQTVVHAPAYIMSRPQAGNMLYLEYDKELEVMHLKLARTTGDGIQTLLSYPTYSTMGSSESLDFAVLSPDGRQAALVVSFSDNYTGMDGYYVALYDIAGGLTRVIDVESEPSSKPGEMPFVSHLSFSPDGRTLAVVGWKRSQLQSLYTGSILLYSSTDGLLLRTLDRGVGPAVGWSGYGADTRIFYAKNPGLYMKQNHQGQSSEWTVVVVEPTSLVSVPLHGGATATLAGGLAPIWEIALSPDGRTLALCQPRDEAVQYTTDIATLEIDDPDNTMHTITASSEEGQRVNIQWSSDGSRILYNLYMGSPFSFFGHVLWVNARTGAEDAVERLAFGGYWENN